MIGHATLLRAEHADGSDHAILHEFGLGYLTTRLILRDIHRYEIPVNLAPHVDKLSFIKNKIHWGTGLRPSLRAIPPRDFDLIEQIACGE